MDFRTNSGTEHNGRSKTLRPLIDAHEEIDGDIAWTALRADPNPFVTVDPQRPRQGPLF